MILSWAQSVFQNAEGKPSYTWLLLLGIVMVLFSTISVLRKRHRRAQQQVNLTAREMVERQRQQRGLGNDLEQLMVEVEQMAKRLGAQLDAKSIELDRLLHRAEKRIAELKQLTGRTGATSLGTPSEDRVRPPSMTLVKPPPSSPAEPDDPLARSVYTLADQGLAPAQIAGKLDEHVGKIELILALRNV